MTRLTVAAAILVSLSFTVPAAAQSQKMRPGLWEHSFTVKSQSGQMEQAMRDMQKEMASLPPEQRRMMEQMMAQQGMGMGASGRSVKVCITREQAERDEIPQQEGNCKQQVTQRTANSIKIKFSCAGNPPTSGEGEVTFSSPTAYTGRTTVNTTVEGRPERMNMEQSGKWLSADCGNIKPMAR